uniref:dTDP-4-dehydrorhamnose reductase family protein n=1 Tax=Eubacterium cellulosolvens TaxID=29322 RepID=UPI0004860561|nr:SDR family oxidoreductase [[Eubacterium] cellulosolvens]
MRFLVLGARGMAGHVIALYLLEQGNQVMGYAREPSCVCHTIIGDVFDKEKLDSEIKHGNYDVVVNCVGILNKAVDGDLATGIYVNSYFPHFLAKCCDLYGSKLIHISSDCVFSGNAAGYMEQDIPDSMTYYGRTKFLGEVTDGNHLTLRTSIVGPELKENGIGLFNWFMHQKGEINGYAHVMWSGVTTLELAKVVKEASEQNLSGLYHLSNNDSISKFHMLKLFNHYCNMDRTRIIKSELPINSKVLVCTRSDFKYIVPDYEVMIKEMGEWIVSHAELYRHYD